jgi:hypothetical protein
MESEVMREPPDGTLVSGDADDPTGKHGIGL